MAGNPFFSGRIPKELNESIIKHCEETGKSKTDILIAALSDYLNIPVTEANNKTDSQISKELNDLRKRMQKIEEAVYQSPVITSDNKDDKGTIVTVIPQSNNLVITNDNKTDNRFKPNKIFDDQNNNQLDSEPIKKNDNKYDNNNNHIKSAFTNLETRDVVKKTGVSSTQMGRLRDKVFTEAKEQGYSIQPDIKFSPPIEAVQKRKEIIIEDIKYKLFCVGIDGNSKPIWMLNIDDNISYQPDILEAAI